MLRAITSLANPTKDTSPWWVGPVPQFWGKPRTFSNPLSCFCHGADPIDGHRKVVGQDQYPALGEVRETAKLLPRGQSPWWRDEGRHLLILCLFSIRGMRLAHMYNAKSREHAHTCRKARAIFKLRYKNKTNHLSGTLDLAYLPTSIVRLSLGSNAFTASINLERLPERMEYLDISENKLSGSLKLDSLPDTLTLFNARGNQFSGSVDLIRLQAAMENLFLGSNRLSGSVVLTRLPESLDSLYFSDNHFSGALNLTRLPPYMSVLELHNNSFCGTVDLSQLPQGLKRLCLSDNELSGEVFISDKLFDRVSVRYTKLIKRHME